MQLPTDKEIEELHRSLAPSPELFQVVYTHCIIVDEIAKEIIEKNALDVDKELVHVGAMLHDVGVYILPSDGLMGGPGYIRHGILGYDVLKERGFPETICRFASHHTGVGITKEEIEKENLPLPPADYLAETPEEEMVMYADKFHSKSNPPKFNSPETMKTNLAKFWEPDVATFENMVKKYGVPDLEALSKKYGHRII